MCSLLDKVQCLGHVPRGENELADLIGQSRTQRGATAQHLALSSGTCSSGSDLGAMRAVGALYILSDVLGWLWDECGGLLHTRLGYKVTGKLSGKSRRLVSETCWLTLSCTLANSLPVEDLTMLDPSPSEHVADEMETLILYSSGVQVDRSLALAHISPIVQLLEPTRFLALAVCRSKITHELL